MIRGVGGRCGAGEQRGRGAEGQRGKELIADHLLPCTPHPTPHTPHPILAT